ncbi:MAG: hypothetical protein SLAVMIC_00437 [uncultured marine phage]|uniref:Uncharacterized protein n=1 Tax=uncultured marine phage TaxID=707152 RepID=A0A8D9CC35_9VIRU|nr:MAG: hypothetical protein SLAVMIC_00437 [uncultured marine phage]
MNRIKVTSENINDLYGKINELIDSYFEWKVKPSSLKRYLKKGSIGLKKFIERNDLGNIDKIDKIILDVVDDRFGMEDDGVLTFERYSTFVEDDKMDGPNTREGHTEILYNNVGDSNIEYEKIIADHYRTSLGHVEVVSEAQHLYDVNNGTVIVFSDEDLGEISNNLAGFIYDFLSESVIQMKTLNISLKLEGLIGNEEDLKSKMNVNDTKFQDDTIDVISEILQNDDYKYIGDFRGYHFWEK